jgi:hypothetical protein
MDIPTACVLAVVWLAAADVSSRKDTSAPFVAAFLATGALLKV